MSTSRLVNRNVIAPSGRTSMRLEPELWEALQDICQREAISLSDLIQRIERKGHPGGRTSAIRVYVVTYFRAAALPRRAVRTRLGGMRQLSTVSAGAAGADCGPV